MPITARKTGNEPEPQADPGLPCRSYLAAGVVYPLWHLATPLGAVDPWSVWWAIGASFVLSGILTRAAKIGTRFPGYLFVLPTTLVTLHLFVLASVNRMMPFYAVGSALAVMTASFSIRNKSLLLGYGVFVTALSVLLFAAAPDVRKVAYWGGMLPVIALAYQRLASQIAAAQLARELHEKLEDQVYERTTELADANRLLRREIEECSRLERQLRLSQTMEAVGRLAGGVAHEFNNLLTTIRLNGELALDRVPGESPLRHELTRIQKAACEAAAVTEQLLDFSRGADIEHEVVDLNQVIREAVLMLKPLLGDRVYVSLNLVDGALPIWAAAGPLERVLLNLTLNARDAMVEGGQLSIETELLEPEDPRVRVLPNQQPARAYASLVVSDTGTGMDPETRERAFDPFFSRKPMRRGSGLGLSIVYGIVRQTNGHVSVDSEPGKGTQFKIIWPCTERTRTRTASAGTTALERGNERILLVEDAPDLRSAIARVLSQAGYEVTEAADANAALREINAAGARIDLMVSDIVMPGITGIELAERLRAERPEMRILLISGHADSPSRSSEPSQADLAFLRKPFQAHILRKKVREVLDAEV